ncbi:hypothetical protein P7K49_008776 [Saguinus oedipus]|uniref:Uncharacterized protein n=1 Tax=Saguinus oedipus TaxID=9490 RepID=A0ABQ9VZF1_SAGOE|nr:hypothetical protein P7K49_008776 [Saguinus oedipus]
MPAQPVFWVTQPVWLAPQRSSTRHKTHWSGASEGGKKGESSFGEALHLVTISPQGPEAVGKGRRPGPSTGPVSASGQGYGMAATSDCAGTQEPRRFWPDALDTWGWVFLCCQQRAGDGEEEEVAPADAGVFNAPIINRFTRHASVWAEAYNPDEEDDDAESKIIQPKTDDQRDRFQEACKDILLFKNLDRKQMS